MMKQPFVAIALFAAVGCVLSARENAFGLAVEPPKVISRSQVEAVFGKHHRFVKEAKGPSPQYQYPLIWRNQDTLVALCVQYDDQERVKWVSLSNCGAPGGLDREPTRPQVEQWKRDRESVLIQVRQKLGKKLAAASWNRKR